MPTMQLSGGYLPQRLAESYGQGVQLTQTDQQRQAVQQTAREQMANQYAIAQMEASAKQQALEQQMAQKSQELEIDKAYKQQQIGLAQAENAMKEKQIEAVAQQAQQQFEERNAIQSGVAKDIEGGAMTPQQALTRQVALHGAGANLPSGLVSDLYDQQRAALPGGAGSNQLQPLVDPEGNPVEGAYVFGTSNRAQQIYEPGKNKGDFTAQTVPGAPEKVRINKTVYDSPQYKQMLRLETDLKDVKKSLQLPKWTANQISIAKEKAGEELTKGDKARIEEWNTQMKVIDDMERKLAPLREKFLTPTQTGTNAPAALPPGVGGGNTNRVGRFEVVPR